MACVFAVAATIIYAFWSEQAHLAYGVALPELLILYLIGGMLGGVIVGALWPLTVWREGAALVGALGALPLYLGAAMLIGSLDDPLDWLTGVVLAGVIGGVSGYRFWSPTEGQGRPD